MCACLRTFVVLAAVFVGIRSASAENQAAVIVQSAFFTQYCRDCHAGADAAAGLDLSTWSPQLPPPELVKRWTKIHDRLQAGDMPPSDAEQPSALARQALVQQLAAEIRTAESELVDDIPRLRRLTRLEYENTIRDLLDLPGLPLANLLPADGSSHGYDKLPEALDISHVNVAKYLEAADLILNAAIATRPQPPVVQHRRISLANRGGFVAHILMNGDGVLLKNGQPDPDFPPAADQNHLDQGAHERLGSFQNGASVGIFRHEDESVNPYFAEHVTIYPGRYRVRTSLWGFQWDRGQMRPGRGTEAARLSVVQLTGDGRGGQHPSSVLGYFDAPADHPQEHELTVWLNPNEILGFNAASLAPTANYARKGRAMAFTGPGVVVDWLEIDGPLHTEWPPRGHRQLFGNLPLQEWIAAEHPGEKLPPRTRARQIGSGLNRPDPEPGLWTVVSSAPVDDARRLLRDFLPQLFRRPVAYEICEEYVSLVRARIAAGDSFELALRTAYLRALCAPDFLYHLEPESPGDPYALAARLSYFLWNSAPDSRLRELAASGQLTNPEVWHSEVERLLQADQSQRFIEDFLGQWLRLRQIAANDPDRKLYPEFSPYLQDCMVAETREFFRELLNSDRDASHLIQSDFVVINQKLAQHYGIAGVSGTEFRRVPLPTDCPRGGLITQASILKITANGTTTSPVPRGAFLLERLLGQPPEPPPASVAAIEPDVRGTTTIREQLAKHRESAVCASCHRKIDPPGFALEAFDVIGGFRERYRSIGEGDVPPRGAIDPFIPLSFRLGPPVDASGQLSDGRSFRDIREYQHLLASHSRPLLRNLAVQWLLYGTGRAVRFSDRPALESLLDQALAQGGGIRSLLHAVVGSPLFTGLEAPLPWSEHSRHAWIKAQAANAPAQKTTMRMTPTLPIVANPLRVAPAVVEAADPGPIAFDGDHVLTLALQGLSNEARIAVFRGCMRSFAEVEVREIDWELATVQIAYAPKSRLFHNAKPEQVVERMNQRLRQLSQSSFGVRPLSTRPREEWVRHEFAILGLDCPACSFAVYETLIRVPGVEQATADFREGRAVAWIDPDATNREALLSALKQKNVTLASPSDAASGNKP